MKYIYSLQTAKLQANSTIPFHTILSLPISISHTHTHKLSQQHARYSAALAWGLINASLDLHYFARIARGVPQLLELGRIYEAMPELKGLSTVLAAIKRLKSWRPVKKFN